MSATEMSPRKVVIIGASNLSLGWPRLSRQLYATLNEPFDIYTAHGMGRSYCGERSGFMFWQLPGIMKSGIWKAIASTRNHEPPIAIITDLGNDLVYGKSPQQVTDAARECIVRLRQWDSECRIVMTRPPVDSVNRVGWFRFLICRLILFPKCPLNLLEAKAATVELAEQIESLASEMNVEFVSPLPDWYGFDPIHVKRRFQTPAFAEMLSAVRLSATSSKPKANQSLKRPKPQFGWRFGQERLTEQPSVTREGVRVFAH